MQEIEKTFNENEDGFEGNYFGYIANPSKEENIANFLTSEGIFDKHIVDAITSIDDECLVIKNMNVDEKYRGQGYGSEIFEEMLSHSTSDYILLIADTGESQNNGFDLIKFYESYGFKKVFQNDSDYPFMVSEELLNEINLKNKKTNKPKSKRISP